MATIKGIEVQINGNSTGLSNALKDINKTLSSTQKELNDVNKQLKFDPKNTELLAQKQEILSEQIANTSEKLKALKDVESQVKQQFENGDLGRDKYVAFQTELSKTEKSLESLKKASIELKNQGFAELGKSLEDVGSKMESVGNKLAPLSATLGALGGVGLNVAIDFEKSMSNVQAITGATEEEFESLKQSAIDLGATTAFSAQEVSDAMAEMAKGGWTTQQILEGMSGVLDATSASGEELGTVATIVADAITGFGLSAKDSAVVADLLTQSANSGTLGINDLGESYKYIAPLAQSMGLSIQDVTTAISAMSTVGIKGSQSGTTLRTVLSNLVKPTENMSKSMEELGIEITNSDGTFKSLDEMLSILRSSFDGLSDDEKAYHATVLGGKEGMSGLLAILNYTQEEYDALSASMNNSGGVAQETASIMQDNLQSKLEQLVGALESLAIKLGDYVIPFLTDMTEKITSVVEKFTNLDESTQKIILVVGGLLTALAPVLIIGGKLISGIGTAIKAVTAFSTTLAVPIAPLLAIVATIGAVVGALVYLWNTNEEFRNNMITIWNALVSTILAILTPFIDSIKILISGALDFITGLVQVFSSLIKGDWQGLWDGIVAILKSVWDTITTLLPTLINGVLKVFTGFLNDFLSIGSKLFNSVWDGMKSVWTSISNWVSDKVSWLADKLAFWKKGKSEMSESDDGEKADGSHANGLSYVPFDNYRAILHQGERVLTAEENKAYSQGKGGNSTMNITQNIYAPTDSPRDMQREARRELVKLAWEV